MSNAVKTLQSWFYSLDEKSKKEVLLFLYYKNKSEPEALLDSVNLGPRGKIVGTNEGLSLGPAPSGVQTIKTCPNCGKPL